MAATIKTVIVTNVPAPYRVPVWRRVANNDAIDLNVVFCAKPHIDTHTDLSTYGFNMHFLSGRYYAMSRRFMHCDLSIWSLLNQLQPDVVVTTGYIPTFLFAFLWTLKSGAAHVAMTDGTFQSEQNLTRIHRLVRRFVFKHSQAFVGACRGSAALFHSYGVAAAKIHLAYLCTENERFSCAPDAAVARADFIFCGRFIAHKRPIFAMQVAQQTAKRLQRKVMIDFVGSGEMEAEMRSFAATISENVICRFHGYASQLQLPQHYANAKIFLFPTEWDPWGVVANEACAAGLPVIVSPHAGVAEELIIDQLNGFICELDVDVWADAAAKLLNDPVMYQQFSENSRQQVAAYNFDASANGLMSAIKQAYAEK